ncbi:hypothetical protein HN592_02785 [Candidatus Woesearchaeota archaeon]|jgi:hypothetical protein|nr:hypothetical protein [Candidatus Woesearchaeota archaeon]MBT4368138.1 hypothetical protein [Candidatus Woesearchaeota archaeon]MBT4712626.1 hypothetical protein [Candidatus Woesearchaeota archaeon]MBT6639539.1 hypothetical protein [Candidatus Woesearchaeota archaeon]MBT7133711.1 hypothetical protein [Candidatus Woesearchaeota archaeon]
MVNETEVIRSFTRVKQDINNINERINELIETQRKVISYLNSIKVQKSAKRLIATIKGKKVHVENCPVAKRIISKNKIAFSSKIDALNKGFAPCACMED